MRVLRPNLDSQGSDAFKSQPTLPFCRDMNLRLLVKLGTVLLFAPVSACTAVSDSEPPNIEIRRLTNTESLHPGLSLPVEQRVERSVDRLTFTHNNALALGANGVKVSLEGRFQTATHAHVDAENRLHVGCGRSHTSAGQASFE